MAVTVEEIIKRLKGKVELLNATKPKYGSVRCDVAAAYLSSVLKQVNELDVNRYGTDKIEKLANSCTHNTRFISDAIEKFVSYTHFKQLLNVVIRAAQELKKSRRDWKRKSYDNVLLISKKQQNTLYQTQKPTKSTVEGTGDQNEDASVFPSTPTKVHQMSSQPTGEFESESRPSFQTIQKARRRLFSKPIKNCVSSISSSGSKEDQEYCEWSEEFDKEIKNVNSNSNSNNSSTQNINEDTQEEEQQNNYEDTMARYRKIFGQSGYSTRDRNCAKFTEKVELPPLPPGTVWFNPFGPKVEVTFTSVPPGIDAFEYIGSKENIPPPPFPVKLYRFDQSSKRMNGNGKLKRTHATCNRNNNKQQMDSSVSDVKQTYEISVTKSFNDSGYVSDKEDQGRTKLKRPQQIDVSPNKKKRMMSN